VSSVAVSGVLYSIRGFRVQLDVLSNKLVLTVGSTVVLVLAPPFR
jgi:hypothetical protein